MNRTRIISVTRRIAATTVVGLASLLGYGCSTISIPEQGDLVHHSAVDGQAFSIGAISQCIELNCRGPEFIQPADSEQQLDPERIAILNWNIYKSQRDNWRTDFQQFIAGRDIVIIQEAMIQADLTEALKTNDYNWNLNPGFYYKDVATGVLTASRAKAVEKSGLRTTEPLLRLPKATLVSRYKLQGTSKQLLVANIHSVNFTLGLKAYAAQLHALKEVLAQHDGPIILAGDFNSWSEKRLHIVEQMMSDLSLQSLSYANHNRTRVFGREIDHVFYRGMDPVTIETREVTSSDHNPIMVTFRLSDNRDPLVSGESMPSLALHDGSK